MCVAQVFLICRWARMGRLEEEALEKRPYVLGGWRGRLSMFTCPFPSPRLNPGCLERFFIPTSASEVQVHQYFVYPQPPDLKRMVLAPQQCCRCCIQADGACLSVVGREGGSIYAPLHFGLFLVPLPGHDEPCWGPAPGCYQGLLA